MVVFQSIDIGYNSDANCNHGTVFVFLDIWGYMVRSGNKLTVFSVHAKDGEIGRIYDFIFDESFWAVRYAEIDIGNWVPGKVILLSTQILGPSALSTIDTKLTIEQIVNCPTIDPQEIPSRKYEEELHNYFSWAYYWAEQREILQYKTSCKLRSVFSLIGFKLQAMDGEIGHLDDVMIDDLEWKVRYWVIDIGSWFFGKRVLVSPLWDGKIDDNLRILKIGVSMEKIKSAPPFDYSTPLTNEYEANLHQHYDKKPYWNV